MSVDFDERVLTQLLLVRNSWCHQVKGMFELEYYVYVYVVRIDGDILIYQTYPVSLVSKEEERVDFHPDYIYDSISNVHGDSSPFRTDFYEEQYS